MRRFESEFENFMSYVGRAIERGSTQWHCMRACFIAGGHSLLDILTEIGDMPDGPEADQTIEDIHREVHGLSMELAGGKKRKPGEPRP